MIHLDRKTITALFLGATLMIMNPVHAGGRVKASVKTENADGGVTTARGAAAKGQNGGGFARDRGTTTNGQGQATGGGATAVKGPNGGTGFRAGSYTADSSGNVNYQGGAAATGANGSASTSGGFSRSAGGGVIGARSTTATANNGNSYQGDTTYDSNSGVNHNHACYDANGNEIKCPSKY